MIHSFHLRAHRDHLSSHCKAAAVQQHTAILHTRLGQELKKPKNVVCLKLQRELKVAELTTSLTFFLPTAPFITIRTLALHFI